jgi:uncharacterized protein (TIGR02996 family)
VDVPVFPATEADLAEWAVYADWLISHGDPRGELIAHELALPAMPDREPLAVFHALGARSCKQREHSPIGWCLGHARTLTLHGRATKRGEWGAVDHGTLANVHQLLGQPIGARLEELACVYWPRQQPRGWQRVFSALPPTCRRVMLTLTGQWTSTDVDELVAWLPRTVQELALSHAYSRPPTNARDHYARFVTDRFAVVELLDYAVSTLLQDQLADAFAATHTVALRVRHLELRRRLGSDRCHLGSPFAAGLTGSRFVAVLEPWPLILMQGRYGVMPIRAQIARELPEDHGLGPDGDGYLRASPGSADLVRRGSRWTIRPRDDLLLWQHGEPLAAITELRDRDEITIEHLTIGGNPHVDCTFFARELDRI